MDLITQDSYEKRHKQSTIPSALAKEKEIKEKPIQKIQPRNYRKKAETTTKNNNCGFCGLQNWTPLHKCPAKTVECNNCHKMGHFARVCRSKTNTNKRKQEINYLEETYTEEEESEPEELQQITQINRVLPDENDNYGIKLKINGKYQNFTIDTGSPVTIRPNNPELYNQKDMKPLKERYQDVNKNEIKCLGKVWADIEYDGNTTKLPILITKRNNTTPLLGVNWLKQLPITINKIQLDEQINQPETIYTKSNKLFETNHTIKNITGKIQVKPGCYPIQQKARPIPYHLQKDVKNELDRLIQSGHLERLETVEEDCFVSPVVITVKKDKTVKIALDARKLNDSCVKKRPHMPNMEELLNQISPELSKNDHDPIWISVIDLDYAYGQIKLAPETSKLQFCDNRRKDKRILPIPERILLPRRHTNDFPRENRQNIRTPNTSLAGRHLNRHTRNQRRTHPKTTFGTDKTGKRRLQSEQEKIKIIPKGNNMAWTHDITRWNQTEQRKNRRNKQIRTTNKHQNTKILSWSHTVFHTEIHTAFI